MGCVLVDKRAIITRFGPAGDRHHGQMSGLVNEATPVTACRLYFCKRPDKTVDNTVNQQPSSTDAGTNCDPDQIEIAPDNR